MLHIVDDEEVVRDSLLWLAKSRGIQATAYDSGKTFLAALDSLVRGAPQGVFISR